MRDELDSRAWADHHDNLAAGIARLRADFRSVFEWLTAFYYDAPWQRDARSDYRR